jgi:hypothetical protein
MKTMAVNLLKKIVFILAAIMISFAAFAEQFERPMIDLDVPSGMERGQMYFELGEKFNTSLKNYPADDFFAIVDGGANIKLGIRYMATNNIEIITSYISEKMEKTAGLAYTFDFERDGFNAKIEALYINYKETPGEALKSEPFGLVSFQTVPFIGKMFVLTLDCGLESGHFGMGTGILYNISEHNCLLAEYYPVINQYKSNTTGCYSFGYKHDTYGHQFIFRVGNSNQIGTRDLMHGTNSDNFYAGFDIMRLFAF